MHEQAAKLIPELSDWNSGDGIDIGEWLNFIARYDHAIAYALMFWPDFVIYDECIFVNAPDPSNYLDWMRTLEGDKTGVESMMNHRHIADYFFNSKCPLTNEILVHVGRLLKDMWSCKLDRDFPGRRINVRFDEGQSDNLLDNVITVYQLRD